MTRCWRAEQKLRKAIARARTNPQQIDTKILELLRGNVVTPSRLEIWPLRPLAVSAGCTCTWWKDSLIVHFDPYCPIWDLHKNPYPGHRYTLEQATVLSTKILLTLLRSNASPAGWVA